MLSEALAVESAAEQGDLNGTPCRTRGISLADAKFFASGDWLLAR